MVAGERGSREVAGRWPRCGRGVAEVWLRCGRGEGRPRCGRGVAEVWPRCGRGAAEVRGLPCTFSEPLASSRPFPAPTRSRLRAGDRDTRLEGSMRQDHTAFVRQSVMGEAEWRQPRFRPCPGRVQDVSGTCSLGEVAAAAPQPGHPLPRRRPHAALPRAPLAEITPRSRGDVGPSSALARLSNAGGARLTQPHASPDSSSGHLPKDGGARRLARRLRQGEITPRSSRDLTMTLSRRPGGC